MMHHEYYRFSLEINKFANRQYLLVVLRLKNLRQMPEISTQFTVKHNGLRRIGLMALRNDYWFNFSKLMDFTIFQHSAHQGFEEITMTNDGDGLTRERC